MGEQSERAFLVVFYMLRRQSLSFYNDFSLSNTECTVSDTVEMHSTATCTAVHCRMHFYINVH